MGCFRGAGGGIYAREARDADCLGWADDERVAERGEGEGKGEKGLVEVHFGRVNGCCAQGRKDKIKQDLVGAFLKWTPFDDVVAVARPPAGPTNNFGGMKASLNCLVMLKKTWSSWNLNLGVPIAAILIWRSSRPCA